MKTIAAEHHAFSFKAHAEPVLRVQPGEVVRFETSSAAIDRLFDAGDGWAELFDANRINAVTGPVYIEGVEPGDAVSVEIMEIETRDWGWNTAVPRPRDGEPDPVPRLRRVRIEHGCVWINDKLSVPVQPMIGCLGLAPAKGATSALAPPYPWGGNYDLIQMKPGALAYFPAQTPGGLFSLGDLHAAMGDGEAVSLGIECVGAATVRLGVRKDLHLQTPRIMVDRRLSIIGLAARGDYLGAKRQAIELMVEYLTVERGLDMDTAMLLFSAAVDLTFGGPAGAVVLATVPLDALSG